MSGHVLDLNDCELRVASGAKVAARSPGFAVILEDATYLGAEAVKRAHLYPRQCYSRFWTDLNQDALVVAAPRHRHHADIAFEHLKSVHEQAGRPAEMLLAVPGNWPNEQLSLLLGIVQALPFKATGLVDAAVAAAAGAAGAGRWQHVELYLHETVLTRLSGDGEMAREAVETLDNGGLTVVHEALAGLVADIFIRQCRFDPLHNAETEQALYDQIPGCLQHLSGRPEVVLEIKYRGARNQVKLDRRSVLAKLGDFYEGILAKLEPGRTPLLGERIASLPGLTAAVPGAAVLPADAVFRGCTEHRAAILSSGPHLNFVTRLPLPRAPQLRPAGDTPATAPTGTSGPAATHVLVGFRAMRLHAKPLFLSARGAVSAERHDGAACSIGLNSRQAVVTPLSDITMYVNGERITGPRALSAGDKIGFAGSDTVCTLISVDDGDAP
ncbi:MAG TPA: hypothetical protein VIC61_08760 [Gammaproteobacteria bacterium]